jgi:hypothetical protein
MFAEIRALMIALELPPLRYATAMQTGLAFIAGFLEACGLIALTRVTAIDRGRRWRDCETADSPRATIGLATADQHLTPERGEEIANTRAGAGCTARLPSADAGVPPRFPAQR